MKLGVVPTNESLHHYIERYAELIEEKSEGRIAAETYPGGALGSIEGQIENVQLGVQQLMAAPSAFARGIDVRYDVGDAPGLFEDLSHAFRSYQDEEFRERFLNLANDKGITGVSMWVYGPTSFATRFPFNTLEDLRGKRIRVLATPLEAEAMRQVGATGVPMPFTELAVAMQNRSIDGVRSSYVGLVGIGAQSTASHLTLTDDGMIPVVAWVSTAFLESLPEDLQKVVLEVGRQVEQEMQPIVEKTHERAMAVWKKENVQIIELSRDAREELMKKHREAGSRILASNDATRELFEVMRRAAERHRPN
ncbi:MAG: TRAP transporter substrate-binding protein [Aquisalimonadaceae bacterium]